MMRKKHLLQNNLMKTKKDNKNAKVTVQYIQSTKLVHNPNITNSDHNMAHAAQEDLEIENVEYLDDNTCVEEYIDGPCEKYEFEDNFYPNAIYCLLDFYKTKYKTLITKDTNMKVTQLWRDIAKDMQESFFDFNERQIQNKYASLREQYFGLQTKQDIEDFEYFEQLHDIYKDLSKENIARGFSADKVSCEYYKDETFFQPHHLESNVRNLHDFKSEEIVHKEHEFIDMVEKELQAMEDGVQVEDNKRTTEIVSKNIETSIDQQAHNIKRVRMNSDLCEEPPQRKSKLNEHFKTNGIMQEACPSCNKTNNDFSLRLYNQEQERRHREKMSLLEKNLQIQERVLEQQQQLLQELINRLS